jgi:hypothetical protein
MLPRAFEVIFKHLQKNCTLGFEGTNIITLVIFKGFLKFFINYAKVKLHIIYN